MTNIVYNPWKQYNYSNVPKISHYNDRITSMFNDYLHNKTRHFATFSYLISITLPFFTVASCDGGGPASEGSKWYYMIIINPNHLLLAGTDNSVPYNWGLFHL